MHYEMVYPNYGIDPQLSSYVIHKFEARPSAPVNLPSTIRADVSVSCSLAWRSQTRCPLLERSSSFRPR
jgi:hypothetical protein